MHVHKVHSALKNRKQVKPHKSIIMKQFLDENFLLETDAAVELYHNHAKKMPIIDYHCHLSPEVIAEDYQFKSLTELWLGGDHYKWRAMRTNGIPEERITGSASDESKFQAWAETVPYTLRNPLYHWTHLELKRAFGVEELLTPETASDIYKTCNEKLATPEFSARGLIRHFNVETLCTTDDPIDDLRHHKAIAESGFETQVLPTWRPDKAMAVESAPLYNEYVDKLAAAADTSINTFQDLVDALQKRHDFFAEMGCRLSDHGITTFHGEPYTQAEIDAIFSKIRTGNELTEKEIAQFQACMLIVFAEMDHAKGWTQQFHYGALRNNNSIMMNQLGPDTGFDSIGEWNVAEAMSRFFDKLNSNDKLAKTIIYNLNPNANEMIATMIGNFQDGSVAGKMQFGSGWWFLDQKDGMERQMNSLSQLGLLSRFVGMLTDSRSFVSYPRHEFFRRILCNLLGNDIENGEIPASQMAWVGQVVEDICYNNAKNYFKFK